MCDYIPDIMYSTDTATASSVDLLSKESCCNLCNTVDETNYFTWAQSTPPFSGHTCQCMTTIKDQIKVSGAYSGSLSGPPPGSTSLSNGWIFIIILIICVILIGTIFFYMLYRRRKKLNIQL